MKREQIIEILKNPHWFLNGKLFESDFERIADAILAIPLDVPTDEEMIDAQDDYGQKHQEDKFGYSIYGITSNAFEQGARWMRGEIIKRNK